MFKSSHLPDGKGADALASTLARTTATDASVNYRMYVPDAETLKISHRPHIGDLLTRLPRLTLGNCGRCSCQLQAVCATETSKFPIARMGKLLTHLLRLSCTTAADAPVNYIVWYRLCTCLRDLKYPIARWGNC
jgi:hypothetical protein